MFVLRSDTPHMSASALVHADFFHRIAQRAQAADVFAYVEIEPQQVQCAARASAAPAWYRLGIQSNHPWVSLVTPDRYLSQSIELDLVHTGDKLEDLLEEELIDLGYNAGTLRFEHFRSEDKLFTFRSKLPMEASEFRSPSSADTAALCLLAYEACFRRLGDMDAREHDD